MTYQQMIERYEEFQLLLHHPEYTLDNDQLDEYHNICADILYVLMKENADVFERLKDR